MKTISVSVSSCLVINSQKFALKSRSTWLHKILKFGKKTQESCNKNTYLMDYCLIIADHYSECVFPSDEWNWVLLICFSWCEIMSGEESMHTWQIGEVVWRKKKLHGWKYSQLSQCHVVYPSMSAIKQIYFKVNYVYTCLLLCVKNLYWKGWVSIRVIVIF